MPTTAAPASGLALEGTTNPPAAGESLNSLSSLFDPTAPLALYSNAGNELGLGAGLSGLGPGLGGGGMQDSSSHAPASTQGCDPLQWSAPDENAAASALANSTTAPGTGWAPSAQSLTIPQANNDNVFSGAGNATTTTSPGQPETLDTFPCPSCSFPISMAAPSTGPLGCSAQGLVPPQENCNCADCREARAYNLGFDVGQACGELVTATTAGGASDMSPLLLAVPEGDDLARTAP